MVKVVTSPRFDLDKYDWEKIGKNALVFLAPFALVFLTAINNGTDIKDALNLVWLYALNISIDILKKFISETKYIA